MIACDWSRVVRASSRRSHTFTHLQLFTRYFRKQLGIRVGDNNNLKSKRLIETELKLETDTHAHALTAHARQTHGRPVTVSALITRWSMTALDGLQHDRTHRSHNTRRELVAPPPVAHRQTCRACRSVAREDRSTRGTV